MSDFKIIRSWHLAETMLEEEGFVYKIEDKHVMVRDARGCAVGSFPSAEAVVEFMYGYKCGVDVGRAQMLKEINAFDSDFGVV